MLSVQKLLALLRREQFATVEPRDGDWHNNPLWGRQFSGVMPPTAGTVFSVASSDSFPGPPALHTVQLYRGDERIANNADVYARISYGVGGSYNSFDMDWGAGAQFSLTASSIRVDAVTYAPDGFNAYAASTAPLVLGATFGKGTVGHGPPVTKTESMQRMAPGAALDFPVPDFARAVIVRSTDLTNGLGANNRGNINQANTTMLAVGAYTQAGNSLWSLDSQLWAGAAGAVGQPLPGGTTYVKVSNLTNLGIAPYLNLTYQVVVQWVRSL
jgi:hypothetical protein